MIALASDHAGFALKNELKKYITEELGYECKDYGAYDENSCNYPEFAYKAAKAVADGECEKGILVCGTGVGISISANKVKGIRCVVCSEPFSAKLSRNHNNTNMLAMGSRVVGSELAKMIAKMWLEAEFEGGRHQKRVELITKIENGEEL